MRSSSAVAVSSSGASSEQPRNRTVRFDRPEQLVPALERLGRRHAGYGVCDAHYESVGAALLWTLAQGLGAAWTPAAQAAWTEAYALIAGVMRHAVVDLAAAIDAPVTVTALADATPGIGDKG